MNSSVKRKLPPGQKVREDFPRFGLPQFVNRFPDQPEVINIRVHGELEQPFVLSAELEDLTRVDQTSDFHCVTTWSCQGLRWSGYRFSELYQSLIARHVESAAVNTVVFRCQDGYKVSFLLADLLADGVLLADTLNGEKLTIEHGAPIRLVAPAHYGYKSAKHISGIELVQNLSNYRAAALNFMEHPRARVEFEERGKYFPGWLMRYLYRPLVKRTVKSYRVALQRYLKR